MQLTFTSSKNFLFLTFLLSLILLKASGQVFLNGDFEINSGFCIINGANATINANLPNCVAYGPGNEIDLMDNACGYGTAISGNYFICIANSSTVSPDAITLGLSAPLISGQAYTIYYNDRGWDVFGCCPPGVPLEVGVSTIAGAQGTVVYTSPVPTINTWTQRVVNFVAPNNGQYISFQAQNNNTRWTHVDCVSMGVALCCSTFPLQMDSTDATCGLPNGSATATAGGGVPPYNYTWSTLPVQNTQTATGLVAGNYSVTVTDSTGCASFGSITINNINSITISINPSSASICQGQQSVILSATGAGVGGTYSWAPAAGLSTTTDSIVTANPSSTTTYTVTGTATNGCAGTDSVVVTVLPIPTSTFSIVPDSICAGGSAVITYTGTGTAAATYNWNFGSGTIISGSGQGPYNVSWSAAGTYNVSLDVIENSCISATTNNSIVVKPLPDASFAISANEICAGNAITVTYTGTTSASANYNWNFGSGTILSGSGQGPYDVQFNNAGIINLTLTITENGCVSDSTLTLIVDVIPTAQFTISDSIGCDSLTVLFVNNSNNATNYTWYFGDGATDTNVVTTHTYQVGLFTVTLIATNAIGCADTLTLADVIFVDASPIAAFTTDPAAGVPVYLSDANYVFTNLSTNGDTYLWDFGDGSTGNEFDAEHQYLFSGNYTVILTVSNSTGCVDTAVVTPLMVVPDPSIYIPNAFTPNGDGINDLFNLIGFHIESFQIQVFNRWGEMIYQSNDIDDGWDGTYKGIDEEVGTYIYSALVTYVTGEQELLKGNVTLVR